MVLIASRYLFWKGSMASGGEGLLTISIGVRVSPEPEAVELLRRYDVALNYAINRILSLDLRSIGRVHNALYRDAEGMVQPPIKGCY